MLIAGFISCLDVMLDIIVSLQNGWFTYIKNHMVVVITISFYFNKYVIIIFLESFCLSFFGWLHATPPSPPFSFLLLSPCIYVVSCIDDML